MAHDRAPVLFTRVRRDDDSNEYFLRLVDRISENAHFFGGNADVLSTKAWDLFGKASLAMGLWALTQDGVLIGHMLTLAEWWDNKPACLVVQVIIDEPLNQSERDAGLKAIESWMKEWNQANPTYAMYHMVMVTPRNNEAWSRSFGFYPYQTVYRREVNYG